MNQLLGTRELHATPASLAPTGGVCSVPAALGMGGAGVGGTLTGYVAAAAVEPRTRFIDTRFEEVTGNQATRTAVFAAGSVGRHP